MPEFKIGDYVTAVEHEGSIGRIVAIPTKHRINIKWIHNRQGPPQSYIEKCMMGNWCRVLSEPEVTLLLLAATDEGESNA